jgi:hypothetical protein
MVPFTKFYLLTNERVRKAFLLSILLSFTAQGGHGFYNSFATIKWLNNPGTTPDSLFYYADIFAERLSLSRAKNLQERHRLSISYAEEKIAESISLFTSKQLNAAVRSTLLYKTYLEDSKDTALQLMEVGNSKNIEKLAERLLQHQYILSVEAAHLSGQSHVKAVQLNKAIGARYEEIIPNTSQDFRDSHFFKKEEVKWSWETSLLE